MMGWTDVPAEKWPSEWPSFRPTIFGTPRGQVAKDFDSGCDAEVLFYLDRA
jgi:hypothetical protein